MDDVLQAKIQQSIALCSECRNTSLETLEYCLKVGGKYIKESHIETIKDCIEVCSLAESFLVRKSENQKMVLELCIFICKKCSESCKNTAPTDEQLKRCSEICEECAEVCGEVMQNVIF